MDITTINGEKHYKISEFATRVGLSAFTLRYYEKEALIKPKRDENGLRYYSDEDASWVKFLLHLKGTGMTINQLKEYVELRAQGDSTIQTRLDLLKKVQMDGMKDYLAMQKNMLVLKHKIDWYEEKVGSKMTDQETFAAYLIRHGEAE